MVPKLEKVYRRYAISDLAPTLVRKTLHINNTCDLVAGGDQGENLFLCSRNQNQFFEKREMYLGFLIFFTSTIFPYALAIKTMQFFEKREIFCWNIF